MTVYLFTYEYNYEMVPHHLIFAHKEDAEKCLSLHTEGQEILCDSVKEILYEHHIETTKGIYHVSEEGVIN